MPKIHWTFRHFFYKYNQQTRMKQINLKIQPIENFIAALAFFHQWTNKIKKTVFLFLLFWVMSCSKYVWVFVSLHTSSCRKRLYLFVCVNVNSFFFALIVWLLVFFVWVRKFHFCYIIVYSFVFISVITFNSIYVFFKLCCFCSFW